MSTAYRLPKDVLYGYVFMKSIMIILYTVILWISWLMCSYTWHTRVTQLVDTLCNSILSLCWCI